MTATNLHEWDLSEVTNISNMFRSYRPKGPEEYEWIQNKNKDRIREHFKEHTELFVI